MTEDGCISTAYW